MEDNTGKSDRLWTVVKEMKSEENLGYRLKENDLIKLGRIAFKIKHVSS